MRKPGHDQQQPAEQQTPHSGSPPRSIRSARVRAAHLTDGRLDPLPIAGLRVIVLLLAFRRLLRRGELRLVAVRLEKASCLMMYRVRVHAAPPFCFGMRKA